MGNKIIKPEDFIPLLKEAAKEVENDLIKMRQKILRKHEIIFNVKYGRQAYPPSYFLKPYRKPRYYTIERIEQILNNPEVEFPLEREILCKMLFEAYDSIEDIAASIFLTAIDPIFTGPDGKPLCATDHLLLKAPGATYPNAPFTTVSLSIEGLTDAYHNLANTPDDFGRVRGLTPKYLLIPPELERRAKELLYKPRSSSAKNIVNVVANSVELITWDRLSDAPTSWFVLTDKQQHSLELYIFQEPTIVVDNRIDYKTRTLYTEVYTTFAVGFQDWRGVYGSGI